MEASYRARLLSVDPQRNDPPPYTIHPENAADTNIDQLEVKAHDDEHQVHLDTDRSFVLYSVGENAAEYRPSHFLTLLVLS